MANLSNIVVVGPFTTFLGTVINLINSAMRIRRPRAEWEVTGSVASPAAETDSPF